MEVAGAAPIISEAKYQKLANEYAKLRAQASVLKKAVLEEQAKSGNLREQLRQRESALRRCEQEVDSLGFRNKQLEQRVAALQDEIAIQEGRKKRHGEKEHNKHLSKFELLQAAGAAAAGNGTDNTAQDAIIFEELQKKIMENAQLTSLIDDKERDLTLHLERILSLEQTIAKRSNEQSDLEKRLRRDLELLQSKNAELETKLVEAASMFGSEDALSASGSDNNTPLQNMQHNHLMQHAASGASSEERISSLEKEVAHWRAQYEIAKLNETFSNNNKENKLSLLNDANCSCSTTAAGLSIKASYVESKSAQRARDSLKDVAVAVTKEQLIYNNFSKKFEDLLKAKCMAESRVLSFEAEAHNLQHCLESATEQLKSKDEQVLSVHRALQMLEDDLTTTRVNYEEQISVLTEQVISLSDQLAACK